MSTLKIVMMLSQLPEDLQQEASHYIEFLQQKAKANNQLNPEVSHQQVITELMKENWTQEESQKKDFIPGLAKGLIKMSDDFDEPLDDFKEYMP